jgi:mRNA-degrading endonuclease RelE of RelBE toxin-antitoxin system
MNAATLISTKEFETKVKGLLSEDELAWLEFSLATNPTAHPVIPGTDGVRKARSARSGTGKRGGIRVIYFYAISAEVILLLSAYAKNEKENLSNEDKKNIRRAVEAFKKALQA